MFIKKENNPVCNIYIYIEMKKKNEKNSSQLYNIK